MALVPLANDDIMSRRSIWLLRHLEGKNPSVIVDMRGKGGWEKNSGGTERCCNGSKAQCIVLELR